MRNGWILAGAAGIAASALLALAFLASGPPAAFSRPGPRRVVAASGPARAFGDGRIEIDGGWRGRVRGPVQDLATSPDGRQTAIAGADLTLLAGGVARRLGPRGAGFAAVAWHPATPLLVAITGRGAVQLYDTASGALRWEFCCSSPYGDARFSPAGDRIVLAGHRPAILEARTGTLIARLTPEREPFANGAVAFLNWDIVAIGNQAGIVRLWRLSTGERLAARQVGRHAVELIAVHPRLPLLVAAARRGAPWVWNYRSGRVWAVPGAGRASALAFSADGASLEIAGEAGWQSIPLPALDPRLTGGPAVLAKAPAAPARPRPSPSSPAPAPSRPAA